MKGLILKDFLNQRHQFKLFLLIYIFWVVIAVLSKNSSMLASFVSILAVILTMNAMAFDDKAKWDKFAATMPISRFDLVFSKYIFSGAVMILALVFAFVIDAFLKSPIEENILTCVFSFSACLVITSVMIPLIFKLGIEKARVALMIFIIVPIFLMILLPSVGVKATDVSDSFVITAICFSPVVALIITFISVKISENIYLNKDF